VKDEYIDDPVHACSAVSQYLVSDVKVAARETLLCSAPALRADSIELAVDSLLETVEHICQLAGSTQREDHDPDAVQLLHPRILDNLPELTRSIQGLVTAVADGACIEGALDCMPDYEAVDPDVGDIPPLPDPVGLADQLRHDGKSDMWFAEFTRSLGAIDKRRLGEALMMA
jgi:hypothetical protein